MKLVIAEKPSVAMTIAKALGVTEKKDGYIENDRYIISWCIGHLADLASSEAYGEKYAKWVKEDLPIIPDDWQFKIDPDKKKQMNILKGLMNRKDVTDVINACDAGREGERIFRTVYNLNYCHKPMMRLWISSMEDSAIVEGFRNLRPGSEFDNLYAASECRARADWLVGINATRLFSTIYHRTLNVGRVVSPTLSILVSRQREINNFIPEDFYKVNLKCDEFTASSEKIEDNQRAYEMARDCNGKTLVCTSVEITKKTEKPPLLYDLTSLQRDANKKLGFTAQQTLDCVQALYEKKLLTYPRTDSRFLTDDMSEKAASLLTVVGSFLNKPVHYGNEQKLCNSSKVSDHYAIIPTEQIAKADIHALPVSEQKILELVAKRLIEAAGEEYIYESCIAEFKCGWNKFSTRYNRVISCGWKSGAAKDDEDIPEIASGIIEGEFFEVNNIEVKADKTKPKAQYTEDTLLSAMENAGAKEMPDDAERKGLGTPATRAGIIEKLISTGFVKREKGKLVPGDVGNNLITVLPDDLKSPLLTADWENRLKEIEKGQALPADFMRDISAMVTSLVRNYVPVSNADELFPSGNEIIGKCPRCGGNVADTKRGYFCETNDCSFGLWKDNKFLTPRHIVLDKATASGLLKDGKVKIPNIVSVKTGKTYSGILELSDDGKMSSYSIKLPD